MDIQFFIELFFFKATFLSGDYRLFHIPFSFFHAESIKNFHFPLWTQDIQTGFPIFAESQTGVFYPPLIFWNFIVSSFAAYQWSILSHFILGGWFFYAYLKTRGLSREAVVFGSLTYLFGMTQAGCGTHNTLSQRVLIWLPLILLSIDQIIWSGKKKPLFGLALLFALQMFAGNIQHAAYAIGFAGCYVLFSGISFAKRQHPFSIRESLLSWFWIGTALCTAMLIAAPQILGLRELLPLTTRAHPQEVFAYQGSVHPLSLATLFYPHWGHFLRSGFYLGVLPVFFTLVSLMNTKKTWDEKFFFWGGVIALAVALGQFNPLYVAFMKVTHFYSFRIPSKWLFFAGFCFSISSAYGFDRWKKVPPEELKTPHRIYQILCAAGVLGLFMSYGLLRWAAPLLKEHLINYVTWFFSTSNFHTNPLKHYLDSWDSVTQKIAAQVMPFSFWNFCFLGWIIVSQVWTARVLKSRSLSMRIKTLGFLVILFLNLYSYGWVGIKQDYGRAPSPYRPSPIIDYLQGQKGIFRVHLLFDRLVDNSKPPLVVQDNIMYHFAIPGAYGSLLVKNYYDLFEGIGGIDDADRYLLPDFNVWNERSALLDFLNVKYLVSNRELNRPYQELPIRDGEYRLYENPNPLPRAFFVSRSTTASHEEFLKILRSGQFQPTRRVYIMDSHDDLNDAGSEEVFLPAHMARNEQESVEVILAAPSAGYLVLSDLFYPGWQARVNGEKSKILCANGAFRAVRIPKAGNYRVRYQYEPFWKTFIPVSGVLAIFCLVGMFFPNQKKIKIS